MILKDEVVIVSGVGAGLGAKLAARAAAEGAKVVLAARSDQVTGQVVKEITEAGGEAVAVLCDVRKTEDVERVAATAVERFGTVTGLVNTAYSHPGFTDLLETPDKQLRRAMDVILFGALEMTRAVVPHMTDGGSIVNVGTMSTRKPMRGEGGYAMAKAAMGCASQYLALELGGRGIRVNQAILGWLDGPGVRFYLTMTADEKGITEQDVYDDIASRNPLNRIPPDEACAGAILYLLSSLASEVTGAVLDVNGGEYMPA
ncbi:SDR family oxidoreductase [Aeromicrobium sp.]|uniref:SDR family oxidoreductase n=1 Tax=Aeromicrobium sp. TaxID=1871063 RepID=UPI002FCAF6CF